MGDIPSWKKKGRYQYDLRTVGGKKIEHPRDLTEIRAWMRREVKAAYNVVVEWDYWPRSAHVYIRDQDAAFKFKMFWSDDIRSEYKYD